MFVLMCQASAERNYHIFYQLCVSRELPEMRSLKLGELPSPFEPVYIRLSIKTFFILTFTLSVRFFTDAPEHFHYTSQGGQMQIPGTDDLADLERTRNAFTILGREKTHTHANSLILTYIKTWTLSYNPSPYIKLSHYGSHL